MSIMYNPLAKNITRYTLSVLSSLTLLSVLCQPSSAVVIGRRFFNSSTTGLSGFIEWVPSSQSPHQGTIQDPNWRLDYQLTPSLAVLDFTHRVATEPQEQSSNGPVRFGIELSPGFTREERGVLHPGGASRDADFYFINTFVNPFPGGRNQIVFTGIHGPTTLFPGIPPAPAPPPVPEPISLLGSVSVLSIGILLKIKQKRI